MLLFLLCVRLLLHLDNKRCKLQSKIYWETRILHDHVWLQLHTKSSIKPFLSGPETINMPRCHIKTQGEIWSYSLKKPPRFWHLCEGKHCLLNTCLAAHAGNVENWNFISSLKAVWQFIEFWFARIMPSACSNIYYFVLAVAGHTNRC